MLALAALIRHCRMLLSCSSEDIYRILNSSCEKINSCLISQYTHENYCHTHDSARLGYCTYTEGSNESHYTVWTTRFNIMVRVRVGLYSMEFGSSLYVLFATRLGSR